jgi:hypothetical protein
LTELIRKLIATLDVVDYAGFPLLTSIGGKA